MPSEMWPEDTSFRLVFCKEAPDGRKVRRGETGDKGREVSTVLEPWHLRLHSECVLHSKATSQSRVKRRCLGLNGMHQ